MAASKWLKPSLLIVVLFIFSFSHAQSFDLTGLWHDNTRGSSVTYRIRQMGNTVYWSVDGTAVGSYANIFFGEISGNTLTGTWVDLPGSPGLGYGTLTLQIQSNDWFVKTAENPCCYGAQEWLRQGTSGGTGNTGFEVDSDRPGSDYLNFDLDVADPGQCFEACQADGACQAWTYVKPGVQGPAARCWLKSSVPERVDDICCVTGTKSAGSGIGNGSARAISWSTSATEHRSKNGQRFSYSCPASDSLSFALWGTDIYTDDSSVCLAAAHVGLISPQLGGTVTIEILPEQQSYTGSTRNGVTSAGYAYWYGSFRFVY
jgi:hypothetical protein